VFFVDVRLDSLSSLMLIRGCCVSLFRFFVQFFLVASLKRFFDFFPQQHLNGDKRNHQAKPTKEYIKDAVVGSVKS